MIGRQAAVRALVHEDAGAGRAGAEPMIITARTKVSGFGKIATSAIAAAMTTQAWAIIHAAPRRAVANAGELFLRQDLVDGKAGGECHGPQIRRAARASPCGAIYGCYPGGAGKNLLTRRS